MKTIIQLNIDDPDFELKFDWLSKLLQSTGNLFTLQIISIQLTR